MTAPVAWVTAASRGRVAGRRGIRAFPWPSSAEPPTSWVWRTGYFGSAHRAVGDRRRDELRDGIDFRRAEQAGWARRTASSRISPPRGLGRAGTTAAYGYLLFTSGPLESAVQAVGYGGHNLVVGDCCSCWWHACVAWSSLPTDCGSPCSRRHCSESRSGAFLGMVAASDRAGARCAGARPLIQHSRSDPPGQASRGLVRRRAPFCRLLVWIAAVFTTSTTVLAADWLERRWPSRRRTPAGRIPRRSLPGAPRSCSWGSRFTMLAVRSPSNVPRLRRRRRRGHRLVWDRGSGVPGE